MIIFDEHNIQGKVLNSHNNSIVRFHSDSNKTNVYCEITITAKGKEYSFKIYPSPDKKYYFNFKEVAKNLFDDLKDTCNYEPFKGIFEDASASVQMNVHYKILFDDLSEDVTDENYNFVYAVMQEWERKQYAERDNNFPLHHIDRDNQTYLICFVGYPFDISFYGAVNFTGGQYADANLFLASTLPYPQLNGGKMLGGNPNAVNRYIASNGESQSNAVFHNYNGIVLNGYVVKIETREQCSGYYLKWRNAYGGWDYYLFEENCTEKASGRVSKEITQDFDTFDNERTRIVTTQMQEGKTLYANRVRAEYLPTLKGLFASPKVYLYLGKKGRKPQPNDWQAVYVKGKVQMHTSNKSFNLKLNINYPKSEAL